MFLSNLAFLKKEPSEKLQIKQFLLKLKNPFFIMAKIFKIGSGLSCPYQILLSPSSTIIEEIFKISPYTEIFLFIIILLSNLTIPFFNNFGKTCRTRLSSELQIKQNLEIHTIFRHKGHKNKKRKIHTKQTSSYNLIIQTFI